MRLYTSSTVAAAVAWCLLAPPSPLAAQGSRPSAAELAAKVQARYSTVRDFTADFTLTLTGVLRPSATTERGNVKVKKPLKMRWAITTGEKNQLISDGSRMYALFPQGKYVDTFPLPREEEASASLLFLAGRGDLTKDFVPSLAADQPAGEWRLTLVPNGSRRADVQSLTLVVDRTTYQMRGLTLVDEQGSTSTYRFSNLRENRGLSDREFEVTIPKGYDIR